MHLYKAEEWQSASNDKWFVNDVHDLAGSSAKWWAPARLLNMSLVDYILLLRNEYHATIVSYNEEQDYLHFYWKKYSDAHKYVLWINKQARAGNWQV